MSGVAVCDRFRLAPAFPDVTFQLNFSPSVINDKSEAVATCLKLYFLLPYFASLKRNTIKYKLPETKDTHVTAIPIL